MDRDAGGAVYMGEVVAKSDLNGAAMLQYDDRSTIATFTSFSPEIPESDSGATLDEERQLYPSLQGDSTASPSGKRSHSLSGLGRTDGRDSDWVFDVFAEDDSGCDLPRWRLDELEQQHAELGLPPPSEEDARERYLRRDVEAPDLATVKDFLRFYIATSQP
jgi:hypothetical protein